MFKSITPYFGLKTALSRIFFLSLLCTVFFSPFGRATKMVSVRTDRGTTFTFATDDDLTALECVGSGAYGSVCRASGTKEGKPKTIAIKRMEVYGSDNEHNRALRELIVISSLNHNNITVLNHAVFEQAEGKPVVFHLWMDFSPTTLFRVIRSKQPLEVSHAQWIFYQLLRALEYLNSANIAHRDIKSENIILDGHCDTKLCDFGLARFIPNEGESEDVGKLSGYVVTRWQRPPELYKFSNAECLVPRRPGERQYDCRADLWSLGCVFAEFMTGKYIFQGSSSSNHFYELKSCKERGMEDIIRGKLSGSLRVSKPTPEELEHLKEIAVGLLRFDPSERISAAAAVAHPFFRDCFYEEDLHLFEGNLSSHFAFEINGDLSADQFLIELEKIKEAHPSWEQVGQTVGP